MPIELILQPRQSDGKSEQSKEGDFKKIMN